MLLICQLPHVFDVHPYFSAMSDCDQSYFLRMRNIEPKACIRFRQRRFAVLAIVDLDMLRLGSLVTCKYEA